MFDLRNLFLDAIRGQHAAALARVKSASKPRRVKTNKYRPHQGAGEIARRATQIQRGTLQPS